MARLITAAAALLLILSATGMGSAYAWNNSVKPENDIPQVQGPRSYVIPGTRRLIEAAEIYNFKADPEFTIHVYRDFQDDLIGQIMKISSRIGWHAQEGGMDNDIILTLPANQIGEVEHMEEDPKRWIREKIGQPPAREVPEEPLVNVSLDIDGFYGPSLWPEVLMYTSIGGMTVFIGLMFSILIWSVSEAWQRAHP